MLLLVRLRVLLAASRTRAPPPEMTPPKVVEEPPETPPMVRMWPLSSTRCSLVADGVPPSARLPMVESAAISRVVPALTPSMDTAVAVGRPPAPATRVPDSTTVPPV